MNDLVINLNNVTYQIGNKTILDSIDLALSAGQSMTVIGHNGAGKSSLLKLLVGDIYSTSGNVQVFDKIVTPKISKPSIHDIRSGIGFIHQGLHLVNRKTALENILMGRLPSNQSVKTWFNIFSDLDYEIAYEALKVVGLHDKAMVRADKLSGGERQKVAIARALAQRPKLMLADEPTAALDPRAAQEIAELLKDLVSNKKISLITVVHSLDLLNKISDRLVVFKKGKIIFDGNQDTTTAELLSSFYRE